MARRTYPRDFGAEGGDVRYDLTATATCWKEETSAGLEVVWHEGEVDGGVGEGGKRNEHLLDYVRRGGELGGVVRPCHFLLVRFIRAKRESVSE